MTPRTFACSVLNQVIFEGGYASIILRNHHENLKEADMALVSELVYGTIRNYDYLEYQWKCFTDRHVRRQTAIVLSMGVYQLLFLDRIPAYAAISEAVESAEIRDKKFVNAVLHKVLESGPQSPEFTGELEKTAFQTSHPLWLMKLWRSHYGETAAIAIARHDQERGVVYGRINTLKTDGREIKNHVDVTMIENECFTYRGILTATDWFKRGEAIIQDRSSQMVVYELELQPGMKVLDTCSAPGTKAQQIAAIMSNVGLIDANDIYESRVALIEELMKRTGVSICRTWVHDAEIPNNEWKAETYDRVLVDAPCSGLGDLRHKPEIRFHISGKQLDELVSLQKNILDTSSRYVKPGGILVYSTCTLNKKENDYQVSSFLEQHPVFRLTHEKTYFPQDNNSDGFYVAQMRKIKDDNVIK